MAETLALAGDIAEHRADYVDATDLYAESLALYRELGDLRAVGGSLGVSGVLGCLGMVAFQQGDNDRAVALTEEGLTLSRELGNMDGITRGLNSLGEIARVQGDLERAAMLYEECVSGFRTVGNTGAQGHMLCNLGFVSLRKNNLQEAEAYFRQSLGLAQEIGTPPDLVLLCVAGLAGVMYLAGTKLNSTLCAVRLLGAAATLFERIGLSRADQVDFDYLVAAARAQVDEVAFAAAMAEGRALTLEQAIAEALAPI
jgi:tetratricopeptide (TPR) repeat protein